MLEAQRALYLIRLQVLDARMALARLRARSSPGTGATAGPSLSGSVDGAFAGATCTVAESNAHSSPGQERAASMARAVLSSGAGVVGPPSAGKRGVGAAAQGAVPAKTRPAKRRALAVAGSAALGSGLLRFDTSAHSNAENVEGGRHALGAELLRADTGAADRNAVKVESGSVKAERLDHK